MATWYVRPDDTHGGANDGTSYADAWQGAGEIVWASLDGTADTLYVCGNWGVGFTVSASGISASRRLQIRGDYAADPCTITYATTRTWTGPDANGEYSVELTDATTPLVVENGRRAYGWNVGSQQRQQTWSVDAATDIITCNPSTNNTRVFADGDKVAFRTGNGGTLPTGVDSSNWYYMRDVTSTASSRTFKVSATLGGDAIDLGALTLPCDLLLQQARYHDPVKGSLAPGEYDWDYPTRTLYFKPSGTFDADRVFVALTNTASGGIVVDTQNYVHVRGFTIWGARTQQAINLDGGTGNEASYNTVYASDGGIIVQGGGTNAHLHHNTVRDVCWHAYGSMDSANAETGMLCEHNTAEDCGLAHDYGDVQMFVTSAGSDGAVWRFNTVTNCGRAHYEANSGIFVCDNSSDMRVYGNTVTRCRGKIFQVGAGSAGGFDNVRFFSNLIIDHNPDGPTSADDFTADMDVARSISALVELDWRNVTTVLGRLEVVNNVVLGGNFYTSREVVISDARRSGVFSFRGAGTPTTLNGPIVVANNIIANVTGYAVEFTGTTLANYNVMIGSDFQIDGNRFWNCEGIGRGGYGTAGNTETHLSGMDELAAFETYTSGTGNSVGDPDIAATYRPMPGSALLTDGADLGFIRDFEGKQGNGYIGAFCAATLRPA